jgi:hypothetical protein
MVPQCSSCSSRGRLVPRSSWSALSVFFVLFLSLSYSAQNDSQIRPPPLLKIKSRCACNLKFPQDLEPLRYRRPPIRTQLQPHRPSASRTQHSPLLHHASTPPSPPPNPRNPPRPLHRRRDLLSNRLQILHRPKPKRQLHVESRVVQARRGAQFLPADLDGRW